MTYARHALHAPLARNTADERALHDALGAAHRDLTPAIDLARARAPLRERDAAAVPAAAPADVEISLTTVSRAGSFDAYLRVEPLGDPGRGIDMVVDSGCAVVVLPSWEDLAASAHADQYQVLATATEPWHCPAHIVRGPLVLPTADGQRLVLPDCVFYACIGPAPGGSARTSNFGVGCLAPWSASAWNVPAGVADPLKPALAHWHPQAFATFSYAAATDVLAPAAAGAPGGFHVHTGSRLLLSTQAPARARWLHLLRDEPWMCVRPLRLAIASQPTAWPADADAIAMVDTGGTCSFLSDPEDLVCTAAWPDPTDNPEWAAHSTRCESIASAVALRFGDDDGSPPVDLLVDPAALPPSAQGLTMVMCHENAYMWGRRGMNTGGFVALVQDLVIDYGGERAGFLAR